MLGNTGVRDREAMTPPFLGIDLAVSHLDTGVCRLHHDGTEWHAIFDRSRRRDRELADLIGEVTIAGGVVAVDVPLGWPRKFIDFLTAGDLVGAIEPHTTESDSP